MRTPSSLVPLVAVLVMLLAPTVAGQTVGKRTGNVYPDFILPTIDGKQIHLSALRGTKVLLIHFASW